MQYLWHNIHGITVFWVLVGECIFVFMFQYTSKRPRTVNQYRASIMSLLETLWPETFWLETFWADTLINLNESVIHLGLTSTGQQHNPSHYKREKRDMFWLQLIPVIMLKGHFNCFRFRTTLSVGLEGYEWDIGVSLCQAKAFNGCCSPSSLLISVNKFF